MEILRYTAFSSDPAGGNPAGIVLDATDLDDAAMQRIAADLGYSETAFLIPTGSTTAQVRYFAPIAEVAFCGHATIAAAVARAERVGTGVADPRLRGRTHRGHHHPVRRRPGRRPWGHRGSGHRRPRAGWNRGDPGQRPDRGSTELSAAVIDELLAALRLAPSDLDRRAADQGVVLGKSPPDRRRSARGLGRARPRSAGAGHPDGRTRLGRDSRGGRPHRGRRVRGTKPVPARWGAGGSGHRFGRSRIRRLPTGARPGASRRPGSLIHQGRHVGRPGLLTVDIPAGHGGISVTGRAVPLE